MIRRLAIIVITIVCAWTVVSAQHSTSSLGDIQNVIIIYQENWSFDGLYGFFPEANGIGDAGKTRKQVDKNGRVYTTLPQPNAPSKTPPAPDTRFPADLPAVPFDLSKYVRPDEETSDLVHRFYQEQLEIDKGKMDKFVAWSDAGGLALSYYEASDFPEGKLAKEFTLADNFFHAAFGGSFLNHMWLVCACSPKWDHAPSDVVIKVARDGSVLKDGIVTPDGYAVNSDYGAMAYPFNKPYPASASDPTHRVPAQTALTIGDRLTERNISWRWYSGGYDDAMAGHPNEYFQFHHQPFAFFLKYADGTAEKAEFLRDEKLFYEDLKAGKLPSVSFIKFMGLDDEHPGYTSVMRGQERVAQFVELVRQSPYWSKVAIFIVYDENGGRWDHVSPPKIDRWGAGTRVPAIIVSPYAKKHYVDHTMYDTTSLLAFIERRWNLRPIATRDAKTNDLTNAFEFGR